MYQGKGGGREGPHFPPVYRLRPLLIVYTQCTLLYTVYTVHSVRTVSVYGGGLEVFGLVSGHLSKVCSSSAPLGPLPLVYIVYTVHTVHSVQCVRWGWVNIYRLVSGHLGKGLLQLLGDSLEFLLLGHQLVLQPVNLRGRRGGHIIILPVCTS